MSAGRSMRQYSFEVKVVFWLVVAFFWLSFLLWLLLPDQHRAIPILARTWPPLLASFVGLVIGKLS